MEYLKDAFIRNWGYFIIPLAVIIGIIWIVGVVGVMVSEASEVLASVFSATP